MKRIISIAIGVLVLASMAMAQKPVMTAIQRARLADGIGRQFACVSASMKNQYGFGGTGDTLASDSTVAHGCKNNINRIMASTVPTISALLPYFTSSQTQLDSSYMYGKWSPILWNFNNAYADSGGLNGVGSAGGVRYSPRFARLARANGIYLAPKTVYSDTLNFGIASIASGGACTFTDSNAIDSTLYGPATVDGSAGYIYYRFSALAGTGSCTSLIYGSNQNLVHGRRWSVFMDQSSDTALSFMVSTVAGDSLYNVDSVKVKTYTGTLAGKVYLFNRPDRVDSL